MNKCPICREDYDNLVRGVVVVNISKAATDERETDGKLTIEICGVCQKKYVFPVVARAR